MDFTRTLVYFSGLKNVFCILEFFLGLTGIFYLLLLLDDQVQSFPVLFRACQNFA